MSRSVVNVFLMDNTLTLPLEYSLVLSINELVVESEVKHVVARQVLSSQGQAEHIGIVLAQHNTIRASVTDHVTGQPLPPITLEDLTWVIK